MTNAMRLTDTRPDKAKPRRFPFTVARLEALKAPATGRTWVYDEACPGLAMMVTEKDARAFYLYRKVNGRPERVRLGSFTDISLADARDLADKHKGEIAKGNNPAHAKRLARSETSFYEAFRTFIDEHKGQTSKSTERDEQRYKLYLSGWASRPLKEIQPEDVLKVRNDVKGKTSGATSNRVLSLVSAIFNKITNKSINPVRGVERFKEKARDRFLAESEVKALLSAIGKSTSDIADAIRVAIFSGVRRGNILAAKWSDVNLTDGLWRIPETKSGQPLLVPLCAEALEVFTRRSTSKGDSPWVFPGNGPDGHVNDLSASWRAVAELAGLKGVRFHDIRRSFAVYMAESGAPVKTTQAALGHATPLTTLKHYSAVRNVREATAAGVAMMLGKTAKGSRKGKGKR
jgi:integrase